MGEYDMYISEDVNQTGVVLAGPLSTNTRRKLAYTHCIMHMLHMYAYVS